MNQPWLRACGILALLYLAAPEPAFAYVGPGTGLAIIGAAIAVVGSVLLGVVGFVWYPVKRLSRRFSRKTGSSGSPTES